MMRRVIMGLAAIVCAASVAPAGELPDGYLPESKSQKILDKTLRIELAPDLSALSHGERLAVEKLIDVGVIFHQLFVQQRHHQALKSHAQLEMLDHNMGSPRATRNLLELFYLYKGPTGRTMANKHEAILPVDDKVPGRNVYPWGVTKEEIDAHLEKFPEDRADILHVRTVVRRLTPEAVAGDLETLDRYPVLDVLHLGLRDRLMGLASDPGGRTFYAVPYAVAYADRLVAAYGLLNEAATAVAEEDPEFSGYLRNRARDLLTNDYESGDASWVTGKFKNLNAQIGAYEVYDDELYGVKAFFGMNVLLRDIPQSNALRRAIAGMQSFENSLPYEPEGYTGEGNKKPVREDIPVGVYHIIADFGQSRGTNTATILPNESEYARKYGRTILMRYNILKNPDIFGIRQASFAAAVDPRFVADLSADGGFFRTLWHEIGHYLGVDRTRAGMDLGDALEEASSKFEELKADLVSLYLVDELGRRGYYSDAQKRDVYASGVRRVLLKNKPSRAQTYQTMELMQLNYYLAKGLLEYDPSQNHLVIHYDAYHDVVSSMLREVLAIQYNGDKAEADAFIDAYSDWRDDLHERLATAMKERETYRYALVKYAALQDQ